MPTTPRTRRRPPLALLVATTVVVVALVVLGGCRPAEPGPEAPSAAPPVEVLPPGAAARSTPPRHPATVAVEAALLDDLRARSPQLAAVLDGVEGLPPGCGSLLLHVFSAPWLWEPLTPGDRLVVEDLRATWAEGAPPELAGDLAAVDELVAAVAAEVQAIEASTLDGAVPAATEGGEAAGAVLRSSEAVHAGVAALQPLLAPIEPWVDAHCRPGSG